MSIINWINILTFYLFYGKAVSSEITNYKIVKLGQPFEAKCVAGKNEDHPMWLFTRDPDIVKEDLTNCKLRKYFKNKYPQDEPYLFHLSTI